MIVPIGWDKTADKQRLKRTLSEHVDNRFLGKTDAECEERLRELQGATVTIPKRCPKCKGEIRVSLFPANHPDGGGSCLQCGWSTGWMI